MFEFKIVSFEQIRTRIVKKGQGIITVKIDETPHYQLLCGNEKAYIDYLEICSGFDKKHSLEVFKKLIRTFNVEEAGWIHCDFIEKENLYFTRDGNHRVCILYYLGHKEVKIKIENEKQAGIDM